ncbi:hypothetical protein GCM10020358_17990 [Amorphoplanes nipponensis]
MQVLEAGDRVDPAQLDRGEGVALGAHRDQAGADELAGAPVDRVHDAVEQHLADQAAAVRLDDLVDGPQRDHRDDLRVPAADLALVARHRQHVVVHPVVAVLLDRRDHLDRGQVVLDQQPALLRHERQPEVLREVVRVDRVAQHHREVLDHRLGVGARHGRREAVHLGVVRDQLGLVAAAVLLVLDLPGGELPQPAGLGVHPAGAGILISPFCGFHLLLMNPLAAEDLAHPAGLRRGETLPGRLG